MMDILPKEPSQSCQGIEQLGDVLNWWLGGLGLSA
jgi:hypothetical protein